MRRFSAKPLLYLYAALVSLAGAAGIPPQYVHRVWRTQDGLPENRIRALAQTIDGYLWIGTSSGLVRFDGVRFATYTRFNTPSMTEDSVRSLTAGRDGSLWIGTDGGGLLQLKGGQFRTYGPKDGLANEFVSSILEDTNGDIWAGTNRGVFRRHSGRFERLDEPLHLTNIAFFRIHKGNDGFVYTGGPAGVFRFENGKLVPAGDRNGSESVYRVAQTPDGTFWLGTNHGLRVVGREKEYANRPYASSMIGALLEDHQGDMWVGTIGQGLFRIGAGGESQFRAPSSLPENHILALLEDTEENIWVGTSDGLVRMSPPDVGMLASADGLSGDNVSAVYCAGGGSVWINTVDGETFEYRNSKARLVRFPSALGAVRLRGAFQDQAGAMWFGSENQGVIRLAGGVAKRFTMADGLRNNSIQAFHQARDNTLWIGTSSGISRWNGSQFKNYYLADGISYGWIRAIEELPNGDILVGTDRGLNRFRGEKFVPDPAFADLSRDRIWAIYAAADGAIWIGTQGAGLVRIRDGKVSRITTQQGLFSNSIFQVVADGKGKLWMSGPRGISSASLDDLNAFADGSLSPGKVLSYAIGHGSDSTQMNGGIQQCGCLARDGQLWFPSVKGAVHFQPSQPRITHPAPVLIETVMVDDKFVPASGEIVVGPGRRRVKIEFTANNLRTPERLTFRYRLANFDPDWMAAKGPREASYDNLPPGKYLFEVTAGEGSAGNVASQAALTLVVEPHLYQTAWFFGFMLLFAGACMAGFVKLRERQAHARYNLRLAERTRIAREMHDTVVQGCLGVSTLIEAAAGSARSDPHQMLECLDNARIHLRLTLDEARQALSDLRHDSFENGLSGALSELVATSSREKGIPVTLEESGPSAPLAEAINRTLILVVREAIRNALAHAAPTAIAVRLFFEQTSLRLEIEDDGCGFEPTPGYLASGHFGILGMRERIDQIRGSFEIMSNPGEGTTVFVYLPLGRSQAVN